MTPTFFEKTQDYLQQHPNASNEDIRQFVGCSYSTATQYKRMIQRGLSSPQNFDFSVPPSYFLTLEGANLIQGVMSELGISQQRLGTKIETTQGTISAWLNGKQGTVLENYQEVYKALGCDPRLAFLEHGFDETYFSINRYETGRDSQSIPSRITLGPLSLYFQKIETMYHQRTEVDDKLKFIRSLDELVLKLEEEK